MTITDGNGVIAEMMVVLATMGEAVSMVAVGPTMVYSIGDMMLDNNDNIIYSKDNNNTTISDDDDNKQHLQKATKLNNQH